jgi:DNA-binding MarR family transcriptional regulator
MVSGLESHLGYWLRFVSNHVSHAFSLKLEARGVTVAEWVVLRELYDQDAVAPSSLAARLGLTRGAISKLAERLAAKALLTKAAGAGGDRRYQDLSLTPSGRRLVPDLSALADRNDAEYFGDLTEAERRTIERAMKKIVQARGLRARPLA